MKTSREKARELEEKIWTAYDTPGGDAVSAVEALLTAALDAQRDEGIEEAAKVFEFWERNRLHGSSTDHIKMQAFKECRLVLRDTKEFEYHLGQALKSAGGSKGEELDG